MTVKMVSSGVENVWVLLEVIHLTVWFSSHGVRNIRYLPVSLRVQADRLKKKKKTQG